MGKSIVFILGTGRSGTSAMSRALALAGGSLPPGLMPPSPNNVKGFWEPLAAVAINDAFLHRNMSAWNDVSLNVHRTLSADAAGKAAFIEVIRETLAQWPARDFLIVKEPRITPLFGYWKEAAFAAGYTVKVVIAVRHPIEIAHSYALSNQLASAPLELLWYRNTLLAERYARDVPHVFVAYSALLERWRTQMARIARTLGLDFAGIDHAAIDDFLESGLRHHRSPDGTLDAPEQCRMRELYDLVSGAANDLPFDPATLDTWFAEYDYFERRAVRHLEQRAISPDLSSMVFGWDRKAAMTLEEQVAHEVAQNLRAIDIAADMRRSYGALKRSVA